MIADRVKTVRKYYKLSQAAFGHKLGVSRDVISNIEYARVDPKDLLIDHLCNTFMVNKSWLLTGQGDMIDIKLQHNDKTNHALKIFAELSPDLQDYALKQLEMILHLQSKNDTTPPAE